MASSLEDELSCAVCCEIFRDPQMLLCGHTFCRQCIDHQPNLQVPVSRTCPVCLRSTHQNPVSNLVLKSTCESYKKEKDRRRTEEEDYGGVPCPRHGLKIRFFCKSDRELICKECRNQEHRAHKVQPLTQAVQQHKDQIRAALLPAEKALESLRKGSALECRVTKYIKSQAEQAEKQIMAEFEKLHQFLRVEQEVRRSELRVEEQQKREKQEELVKWELQALSDRVMGVEEELQNDDVTFLRNFNDILLRAQYRPHPHLDPASLIDVVKHMGNLRYNVWEKMKDVCPCYPVILDPNSAPPQMSVSGELTAVRRSAWRFYSPNPLQEKGDDFRVLGSIAQNFNFDCWDVEVGDNKSWKLGVYRRSLGWNNVVECSMWGLCRTGDLFYAEVPGSTLLQVNSPPKTVRMKLVPRKNDNTLYWSLSISDASRVWVLCRFNKIPFGTDLCPFLTSQEKETPLSIVPVKVNITPEKELTFLERRVDYGTLARSSGRTNITSTLSFVK
ncbi:tripartite motif containing 35-1 [Trichomycterus rosablanca]|uniref:tripartite motif containing 35-1 n=1 Tax=Trichomycterus rosablanca TaxID=2290929 RepID=UPI002F35F35D